MLRLGGAQIDLSQALVEEKDLKDPIDLGGAQSDLAVCKSFADPKGTALKAELATRTGLAEQIVRSTVVKPANPPIYQLTNLLTYRIDPFP